MFGVDGSSVGGHLAGGANMKSLHRWSKHHCFFHPLPSGNQRPAHEESRGRPVNNSRHEGVRRGLERTVPSQEFCSCTFLFWGRTIKRASWRRLGWGVWGRLLSVRYHRHRCAAWEDSGVLWFSSIFMYFSGSGGLYFVILFSYILGRRKLEWEDYLTASLERYNSRG
ncbi:unnamed protein product, partial [Ectocarpus sp. 12 AP-2014]